MAGHQEGEVLPSGQRTTQLLPANTSTSAAKKIINTIRDVQGRSKLCRPKVRSPRYPKGKDAPGKGELMISLSTSSSAHLGMSGFACARGRIVGTIVLGGHVYGMAGLQRQAA